MNLLCIVQKGTPLWSQPYSWINIHLWAWAEIQVWRDWQENQLNFPRHFFSYSIWIGKKKGYLKPIPSLVGSFHHVLLSLIPVCSWNHFTSHQFGNVFFRHMCTAQGYWIKQKRSVLHSFHVLCHNHQSVSGIFEYYNVTSIYKHPVTLPQRPPSPHGTSLLFPAC